MRGIKSSIPVKGIGTVEWTIRDVFNNIAIIRTSAYYVPDADIRLFSPQTYIDEQEVNSPARMILTKGKLELTTAEGNILTFPINPGNNLPLMFTDSSANFAGLSQNLVLKIGNNDEALQKTKSLLEENHNLSKPQKELLRLHY